MFSSLSFCLKKFLWLLCFLRKSTRSWDDSFLWGHFNQSNHIYIKCCTENLNLSLLYSLNNNKNSVSQTNCEFSHEFLITKTTFFSTVQLCLCLAMHWLYYYVEFMCRLPMEFLSISRDTIMWTNQVFVVCKLFEASTHIANFTWRSLNFYEKNFFLSKLQQKKKKHRNSY